MLGWIQYKFVCIHSFDSLTGTTTDSYNNKCVGFKVFVRKQKLINIKEQGKNQK